MCAIISSLISAENLVPNSHRREKSVPCLIWGKSLSFKRQVCYFNISTCFLKKKDKILKSTEFFVENKTEVRQHVLKLSKFGFCLNISNDFLWELFFLRSHMWILTAVSIIYILSAVEKFCNNKTFFGRRYYKSSPLNAILIILLSHKAFRVKVTRNTLKTRWTTYIRPNTTARSLFNTAVENQILLLSCIGDKKLLSKRFYLDFISKQQKKKTTSFT